MSGRNLSAIAVLSCGLCLFGGYRLRVFAEGAPEDPSLFYSGTLEQEGEPANGDFTINLALYSAARGGNELCRVESEAAVENGRFRIDATDCEGAVRDNANTWVEVAFSGEDGVEQRIEGRSKLGAVPYAIEAAHAVSASSAEDASGELEERLQSLTDRVEALEAGSANGSAFQGVKTAAESIDPSELTYVAFDTERFDYGDEYEPSTGTFIAKKSGVYAFSCTVGWASAPGVVAQWESSLHYGDLQIFTSGDTTDGQAATRTVYGVMRLEAGMPVRCGAYQNSPAAQPLEVDWAVTTFEGHRLAQY